MTNRSNRVLIAYATKGGVTREAATLIADVLRNKHGLQVDLVDLRREPSSSLAPYRSVVVGSGVRIGKVYKEAPKFLETDFGDRRVALFIISAEAGNPKTHDEAVTKYLRNVLEARLKVKPVAAEAFGGRMKILGLTLSDDYDQEKVRAWAEELGRKLSE